MSFLIGALVGLVLGWQVTARSFRSKLKALGMWDSFCREEEA